MTNNRTKLEQWAVELNMQTEPEQWAVELACAVQCEVDEIDAAKRIQRAFEDRERKLRDRIAVLEFEANGPPAPHNAKAVSIFDLKETPDAQ